MNHHDQLQSIYQKYPDLAKEVQRLKARNQTTYEFITLLEERLGSGFFNTKFSKAISYVGGVGQLRVSEGVLDLLKFNGVSPDSNILEIGCGCLLGTRHILRYQQQGDKLSESSGNPNHRSGKYVGIEPNQWLIQAALEDPSIADLVQEREAQFLDNLDFDASETGIQFDYCISHSILSHAAGWQLDQYLRNVTAVLKPSGVALASLRLTQPNNMGNRGSAKDEREFTEWVYPESTFFRLQTVIQTAQKYGYNARVIPEYTGYFCGLGKPYINQKHDWILFTRNGQGEPVSQS